MAYLGGTTGICRVFPFMASTNYDFVEQVDVFSHAIQYNTMAYLCIFVFDGAKFGRQVVIQYPSDQTWKAFHCSSMGNSYCVDYSLTINITDWSKRTSVQ